MKMGASGVNEVSLQEDDVPETPDVTAKSNRFIKILIVFLVLSVILAAWNAPVFLPVHQALDGETDASMVAYRSWLVSPSKVVLDVRSVEGTQSMAGMDRMLLKAAEGLKDSEYGVVVLAYRGEPKLLMDGAFFQELGVTRQTQNPIYTMRTMQEHIQNLDGSPAFGQWSGGWLGVLGKQLEDHGEFHRRWWMQAASGLS